MYLYVIFFLKSSKVYSFSVKFNAWKKGQPDNSGRKEHCAHVKLFFILNGSIYLQRYIFNFIEFLSEFQYEIKWKFQRG